jgi:hypothetical protein
MSKNTTSRGKIKILNEQVIMYSYSNFTYRDWVLVTYFKYEHPVLHLQASRNIPRIYSCNISVSKIQQIQRSTAESIKQLFSLHDGIPAHSSWDVIWVLCLDSHFPGWWIGWNGPIVWLLWSPSHTPAGSYLWGDVKSIVYNMQICCWIPLKWLGQYATCLTSFIGPAILGATGLSYALTVMVGRFNIFCKLLTTGQMLLCSQLINCLSIATLFVYFSFHVHPVAISY